MPPDKIVQISLAFIVELLNGPIAHLANGSIPFLLDGLRSGHAASLNFLEVVASDIEAHLPQQALLQIRLARQEQRFTPLAAVVAKQPFFFAQILLLGGFA